MSASPSKDGDGGGDVSADNSDQPDRVIEGQAADSYDFDVKEQDRWLPIANVARIMKAALPDNAKIAREAKECMQECVSEFISFITSEASDKCQQEKRKTVNGEDVLFAMSSTGFENYAEALTIYLAKYRASLAQRSETTNAGPSGQQDPSFGSAQNAGPSTANVQAGTFQGQDGSESIITPHNIPSGQAQATRYPGDFVGQGPNAENTSESY